MILKRLSILNYKNIAEADLTFSPSLNCFIGQNGEGKTNLLDAIHFLSLCKSATTAQDSMVIRHGEDLCALHGDYEREDGGEETIRCGIKRGEKKVVRRGAKAYKRLAEHVGLIPLVMVSPSDQMLITGGSEERRRFMDIVISQYDRAYLESLMRYNKALMQRNALLRQEEEPEPELISLWEEEMARQGEGIYRSRNEFITRFTPYFSQYYRHISQQREEASLTYTSHCQRGALLDVIQRDRDRDRAVGYSLHGIHRDDIEMMLGGYPIRREGSQGQSKTYLLAMKLAQFQFLREESNRNTPLLLLDDIFDKLDAQRVAQIVRLVTSENFGQIFITDTNREHLDLILEASKADYRLFHVQAGQFAT